MGQRGYRFLGKSHSVGVSDDKSSDQGKCALIPSAKSYPCLCHHIVPVSLVQVARIQNANSYLRENLFSISLRFNSNRGICSSGAGSINGGR